jgi:hypothetical protein
MTEEQLKKIPYNTTVVGTIISRSLEPNQYTILFQGVQYEAFSLGNDRLNPGDSVYILVLNNTLSNKKMILGRTDLVPGVFGDPGFYGSFYDDQDQTAALPNVGYPIYVRDTFEALGVSLANNSKIVFNNYGTYNIQFSLQFRNTQSNDHDVAIWLKLNGNAVDQSGGFISVPSKHGSIDGHTIASWNYVLTLDKDDFIELYWTTNSTTVSIAKYAASLIDASAAIPSVIVTAAQVANSIVGPQGPKGDPGYGVPPGGTTGQVLAKASNDDYDVEWTSSSGTNTTYTLGSSPGVTNAAKIDLIGSDATTSSVTLQGGTNVTITETGSTITINSTGGGGGGMVYPGAGIAVSTGTSWSTSITNSAGLASNISDETGTGSLVFANSPTLVTPNLGTPSALTLTNATGLPVAGISNLGAGVGSFLTVPTSAHLAAAVTDETGTGSLVFANSPVLITPSLGVATASSINGTTIPSSKTLLITDDIGVSVQGYDGDLQAIGALTGTSGLLRKTNTNTWTLDTNTYLTSADVVTSFSGASTGLTPSTASTGSITLGGVLVVSHGGTGTGTAGIGAFNNITGYTATGATGTTNTNLVFSASPTLSGTPLSTTAVVDTNTTQIATTAFVLGQASSINPLSLGTVAIGTSLRYARADHVHPTTGLVLISDIGTTVQAYDADLSAIAALSGTSGFLKTNGAGTWTVDTNTYLTATTGVTTVNGNSGAITNVALTTGTLAQFASTTSAQLAGVISDETGSGALVFATSPSLTTPNIGVASGTSLTLTGDLAVNGGDITTTAATFNLIDATATTVNFAGAATALTIGASTGTLRIENPTITTSVTSGTLALFNTGLTGTLNIGNAAATLSIGNAATTSTFGYTSTAASTTNISTGAVANTITKTINIGTGGASGSNTNVFIGSATTGAKTVIELDGVGTANIEIDGTGLNASNVAEEPAIYPSLSDYGSLGKAGNSWYRIFSIGTYNRAVTGRTVLVATNGQFGTTSSSKRFKDQIENYDFNYSKLLNLEPKTYFYNLEDTENDKKQLGFIAEDAQELGLEYLYGVDDQGIPDYFAYEKLPIYLVGLAKEQQKLIGELRARIEALENK